MQFLRVALLLGCFVLATVAAPQEPNFELPVQLVGFPVIIAAVRITNFVKKLAYSLNPETYASRVRRQTMQQARSAEFLDAEIVEKKLVDELGEKVCIFQKTCEKYAIRRLQGQSGEQALDWDVISREYKLSPGGTKDNYLLSVFIGNLIGNPKLCRQLAKRGRSCEH